MKKQSLIFAPSVNPRQQCDGLTLSETSCYDVEAVREAPVQRKFLSLNIAEPGLLFNVFMLPL